MALFAESVFGEFVFMMALLLLAFLLERRGKKK